MRSTHELLDLEGLEGAEGEAILLGVEKLPHRAIDCVMMQRVLDLSHLYPAHEIGNRSAWRARHQADLAGDGVAMIGGDGDALQRDQHLNPFCRPSPVSVTFEIGQGAERKCGSCIPHIAADLVMIALRGERQRQQRTSFIEGEDLGAAITPELCRDQRQECRLAGAGRTED